MILKYFQFPQTLYSTSMLPLPAENLVFQLSKMLLLRVIVLNFLASIYTHFHMQPKFRNNSSLVSEEEMLLLLLQGSLFNCAFCPMIVSLTFFNHSVYIALLISCSTLVLSLCPLYSIPISFIFHLLYLLT